MIAFSAAVGDVSLRLSSSQPTGLPWCCSICRASLSPIGRDDLIWLHMLGEISSVAAKACSSPLGGAPPVNASCPSLPDGSRTVAWNAGPVEGKSGLVYAAVMEGEKTPPGIVIADKLKAVFAKAGI